MNRIFQMPPIFTWVNPATFGWFVYKKLFIKHQVFYFIVAFYTKKNLFSFSSDSEIFLLENIFYFNMPILQVAICKMDFKVALDTDF